MKQSFRWIAVCLLVVGCSVPLAQKDYDPIPVESDGIRVTLRQVHRGEKGGLITVEVSNHGVGGLEIGVAGKAAQLRTEDGTVKRALSGGEFKRLVSEHGPIAMGIRKGGDLDLPTFDRECEVSQEDSAWFQIPFELPATTRFVNVELTEVIRRRAANGSMRPVPEGISIAVALPDVPPPSAWKKMHFGLSTSSDNQ